MEKIILFIGVFLHQSMITPLGNLSISDFILVLFIVVIVLNNKVIFNKKHLIVILFFLIYLVIISVYLSPTWFSISLSSIDFISEITKLLVLFIFFYCGYLLVRYSGINKLLKVYSYVALFIGLIGILFSLLNFPMNSVGLFKYGERLNGFMNDPNYFAILQITALPYFLKKYKFRKNIQILFVSIIIFSIILSGSKTGLLTLFIYLCYIFFERKILGRNAMKITGLIRNMFLIGVMIFALIIIINNLNTIIYWLNTRFPVSTRITSLFTDFESAISTGGSERDIAWNTGLNIIKASPVFGVGISNYSSIAIKYFGIGVIAHNTYIQLAAEWGLPITLLFFGSIIILIIKIITDKSSSVILNVQKDILIIFLIGSVGISLNNARFFWLILGATYALVNGYTSDKKEKIV